MKVLVDTSVWIDHFHRPNQSLGNMLESGAVITHRAVMGEIACGSMRHRKSVLDNMRRLTFATDASFDETLVLIDAHKLWGRGLGWSDAQLLAACRLESATLWTRDRVLKSAAISLGVQYGENLS